MGTGRCGSGEGECSRGAASASGGAGAYTHNPHHSMIGMDVSERVLVVS